MRILLFLGVVLVSLFIALVYAGVQAISAKPYIDWLWVWLGAYTLLTSIIAYLKDD